MAQGLTSPWWDENLYFAHFALQHRQNMSRLNALHVLVKQKSHLSRSVHVLMIGCWPARARTFLPLRLTAQQGDYAIDISLTNSVRVLHGDNGLVKRPTVDMPLIITVIRF